MKEYPTFEKLYHNFENKIAGAVRVLSIAAHYDNAEEYVVYQNVCTGTISVIELDKWNETISMSTEISKNDERPRFYHY